MTTDDVAAASPLLPPPLLLGAPEAVAAPSLSSSHCSASCTEVMNSEAQGGASATQGQREPMCQVRVTGCFPPAPATPQRPPPACPRAPPEPEGSSPQASPEREREGAARMVRRNDAARDAAGAAGQGRRKKSALRG